MAEGRFFILFFVVWVSCKAFGQTNEVDHWEMAVSAEQEWAYFTGTSEPPANWSEVGFDDSDWPRGNGGIGYGDGDDRTEIDPVVSLYMRKSFSLVDTSTIEIMMLHMDYDDGFVAYLNGEEIARSNVSGQPPSHNTLANDLHEALMYRGNDPEAFQISKQKMSELIFEGENVLAVQVHNRSSTSSDLSAIPFLSVGISDTTHNYMSLPSWFVAPLDYTLSELPVLAVNTMGRTIRDEPRIKAWMDVIDRGPGNLNSIYDEPTGYQGWITIEIRGESAQMFPKKSYSFETQDSVGENNNVSLLGLTEENDWILYGPYSDKTLIKNVLTYHMARELGMYATRTRFCELFINDQYRGLYVLMEKIKQDDNRVDIARLRPEDVSGNELTGGYILRVDKIDDNDYPAWEAYPELPLSNAKVISYQYYDPDGFELQREQREYIRNFMREFEMVLSGPDYVHYEKGFRAYIDRRSFIDFLIINEISKNIDAYIFSTYMYKTKDSDGGKLHMGPVWDFNIAYGNVDYNDAAMQYYGWMYEDNWRMYWFRRMMRDRGFSNALSCRWHSLRDGMLADDMILDYIDSLVASLEQPVRKNFNRWPVLGQYVWPNELVFDTYEEEIGYLKQWLTDRLQWMDDHIPEKCVTGFSSQSLVESATHIYPNPFSEQIMFDAGDKMTIKHVCLYDKEGRLVDRLAPRPDDDPVHNLEWRPGQSGVRKLNSGLYVAVVELNNGARIVKKIMKK